MTLTQLCCPTEVPPVSSNSVHPQPCHISTSTLTLAEVPVSFLYFVHPFIHSLSAGVARTTREAQTAVSAMDYCPNIHLDCHSYCLCGANSGPFSLLFFKYL
jgi:hypothetical protein